MATMATAGRESVDVILRDGGTLRLRAPVAGDAAALLGFYRTLSRQSLHRRFHGLPHLGPQLVESILDPDWSERGASWARSPTTAGSGSSRSATTLRLRDPTVAESAFAVADDGRAAASARVCSSSLPPVRPTSASSASSPRCCRRTSRCWPSSARRLRARSVSSRAATVEVRFPIAPTELPRRVDERDHTAVVASLRPFFAPRAWPSSVPPRGAGRSAASSSATCSRATSPAPRTR